MEACLADIALVVVDRELRELCFRLCAEMMKADASLEAEEADALGTLQDLFGFTPDDVRRLIGRQDRNRV